MNRIQQLELKSARCRCDEPVYCSGCGYREYVMGFELGCIVGAAIVAWGWTLHTSPLPLRCDVCGVPMPYRREKPDVCSVECAGMWIRMLFGTGT